MCCHVHAHIRKEFIYLVRENEVFFFFEFEFEFEFEVYCPLFTQQDIAVL